MSVCLSLRRFRPGDPHLCGDVELLIGAVPITSRVEEDAGLLVSLGEEWVVVLAALAGDDTSTATVGHRAVLGGEFLGRTETEVAVLLTPDAVRRVAAELASDSVGGDGEARVLRHLDAVEAAHGATAGDGLRRRVAAQVEALAGFYAVAAAQGDVVVKVAYS